MVHTRPACSQCSCENAYPDVDRFVCPDGAHRWPQATGASDEAAQQGPGTLLADGDAAILIKDLKVKGASTVLQKGRKIKGICLADGRTEWGHMLLKAEFFEEDLSSGSKAGPP